MCRCSCESGKELIVRDEYLKQGKVRSCGCLATENKSKIGNANVDYTFEQWCIDHQRCDILNLWDSEKNNCLPSDIGYSSGKKYYFKCKYGKDHSTLRSPSNITKNGTSDIMDCEICNSFATYLINLYGEDAIEKYWDFDKNNVDVFKVRKQTNKKIYIKCQENIAHGSYKTTGNHFSRGQRCPYCSGKSGLIMPEDSLGALHPKSLSVWVGDELCSPYSLAPQTHKKFLWKCNNEKHDNYMRSV